MRVDGSISFDRIAARYDQTRGGVERGTRIANDIAPLLRPDAPVLDVGIGTGLIAAALVERGFDVLGIDISPEMARRAFERIGARVGVGDAAHLPVADSAFAQASSTWLLHLVGDAPAVLREVARVLRPGSSYVVVMGSKTVPDAISAAVGPVFQTLSRRRWSTVSSPRTLAMVAPACGFFVEPEIAGTPYAIEETPWGVAEQIETRTFSYLWDLDDETWRTKVEPVIERLRAMPNETMLRRGHDRIVVLRRR